MSELSGKGCEELRQHVPLGQGRTRRLGQRAEVKPNTSKEVANVEGASSHLMFRGHVEGVGDSNDSEKGRGTT